MTGIRSDAGEILLGVAPGPPDEHLMWAVGAHFAWHAAQLARAWDGGPLVDSDYAGATLSDGRRWRIVTANRRRAELVDRDGREVATVRLADAARLISPARLPARLVADVRQVLEERAAVTRRLMAANQRLIETGEREINDELDAARSGVERRCAELAEQAWEHVRPVLTLFDISSVGSAL